MGIGFREHSVMRRIVSLDFKLIEASSRHKILSILLEKELVSDLDWWTFNKIYNLLDESGKNEFLRTLEELINEAHFNSFHYNLIKFYKKNRLAFDEKRIHQKIKELRI